MSKLDDKNGAYLILSYLQIQVFCIPYQHCQLLIPTLNKSLVNIEIMEAYKGKEDVGFRNLTTFQLSFHSPVYYNNKVCIAYYLLENMTCFV